ncbi:MATE family efflux transporter [Neobittarella massiliensis]|uniref:MATE family efflux transporter n=1 Tax=Neobittarella massiliensis (ex Bilen et al. 2018) TaxID=2041842 RepID=UPI000CF5F78E|nr:MATE family efflux transporter [Neobittarella massiliensis]
MAADKYQQNITEGVIWKQLLAFFFPILLGTFFQQLYNTADAIVVGNFVGKQALAAVGGSTGVLINLFVNLFVGISSGATVVIAQYYGAARHDDVHKVVHSSTALAIVAGGVMTVVGVLIAPFVLRAMGTPADIMDHALTYLRVYFFGMIASFIYNMGSGVLRAVGDTRRPLYFLIAACLTNIALDLLFVALLGMGVLGVALATVLSQILSAVLVVLTLSRSEGQPYQLTLSQVRFSKGVLGSVFRVGIPAGLQSNMYTVSNIILQSCINSFGTNTVAAWTAFGKIDGFFWMIMGAFGVSITTFVGQNFGAQKYHRVRQSVRVCLGLSFGVALVASSLLYFFCQPVYRLFTADGQVIDLGVQILRSMVPFYFTYICVEILAGAIRGTGDSIVPMLITCGGVCVLRVLWVLIALPFKNELSTVLASYPITWTVTSLLFIIYYLRGGWLRRRIAAMGFAPEQRRLH